MSKFRSALCLSLCLAWINPASADIVSIPNSTANLEITSGDGTSAMQGAISYADGILEFELRAADEEYVGLVDSQAVLQMRRQHGRNPHFRLTSGSAMPMEATALLLYGPLHTLNRIANPASGLGGRTTEEVDGNTRTVTVDLPTRLLGAGPYSITPRHSVTFENGRVIESRFQLWSSEGITLNGMHGVYTDHDPATEFPRAATFSFYALDDNDEMALKIPYDCRLSDFKATGGIARADYSEEANRRAQNQYAAKTAIATPEKSRVSLYLLIVGGSLIAIGVGWSVLRTRQ